LDKLLARLSILLVAAVAGHLQRLRALVAQGVERRVLSPAYRLLRRQTLAAAAVARVL
jgi:hypothetical protein